MNRVLTSPGVVIKFGDTRVSLRASWQNIAAVVELHRHENKHLLMICSAPSQVSNQLECLLQQAVKGEFAETLVTITNIYRSLCEALQLDFQQYISTDVQQLEQRTQEIALLQEASPRVRAQIQNLVFH